MSVDFDQQLLVDDQRFGSITVTVETHRSVAVESDNVPLVRIARTQGSATDEPVPVGTRQPRDLAMTVDREPVSLSPSRGRLSRKSYRVDVEYMMAHYRLQPSSSSGSRLTRDGRHLGEFFRQDGDLVAQWEAHDDIRPSDAALGYALSAAFGTGAQSPLMAALDLVAAVTPG